MQKMLALGSVKTYCINTLRPKQMAFPKHFSWMKTFYLDANSTEGSFDCQ